MAIVMRTLAVVLVTWSCIESALDTSEFDQQIRNLAHDILGVDKYQEYLDTSVNYVPIADTASEILDKLTNDLQLKIDKRVAAVRTMAETLTNEFSNFDDTTQFADCCQCCSNTDETGRLRFKGEVDLTTMCHTGEGTTSTNNQNYPTQAFLNVMIDNLEENPELKWAYFGGEDGVMTIYPANKACDSKFDPRYRSWYSHSAFSTPKDIMIVIDQSGSMSDFHNNRALMDIAIEAGKTVIDTLNPDDRVGVVFFSTQTKTLGGSCHGSRLAFATPENKDTLKDFIDTGRANGNTYYDRGFQAAFNIFTNSPATPQYDKRARVKVILFLTDGRPSTHDYKTVIPRENAKLNNEVIIFTFGLGGGIAANEVSILTDIARQTFDGVQAAGVMEGEFVHVTNPSNLRYSMARYYDYLRQQEGGVEDIVVSVPYIDAFGLGLILSVCQAVQTGTVFRGVTCIDITLSDLFSDATYFSTSAQSYAFIADGKARLLVHPLLPRPADVYEQPAVLRITDLERADEIPDIVSDYMLRGIPGLMAVNSKLVISRGNSEHDGVDQQTVPSTYIWNPVGFGNLTLCLVMANSDEQRTISGDLSTTQFPYHRLDVTQPPNRCRYINRVAITDSSTIKLAPFSFQSIDTYLQSTETSNTVQRYQEYFANQNEASFRAGVREAVSISGYFDQVISQSDSAWQSTVWRYLGLREGVLRLFPGSKLVKQYDHTVRPWYKSAAAQLGKITLTKPYVDAFGAGVIITLASTVYEGRPDNDRTDVPAAGVMGMDFTLELFNSFLTRYITQCRDQECFVIDTSGYILAHKDFEEINEAGFYRIENVHITQKEAQVATLLKDQSVLQRDGCINYENTHIQTFWRVTRPSYSDSGSGVELYGVDGTNMFVVVKATGFSYIGSSSQCSCSTNYGEHIPQCARGQDYVTCECPCYTRSNSNFDECDVEFNFDAELGSFPPCAPASPELDLASVAEEERYQSQALQYCYNVQTICPAQYSQLNCSSTAGCRWCEECEVRTSEYCPPVDGDGDGDGDGDLAGEGNGSGTLVAAVVVPILLILVIVAVILTLWFKGVICRNSPPSCVKSSSSTATPVARGGGSGPPAGGRADVYVNPAMSHETAFNRAPPTAPGYGQGQGFHDLGQQPAGYYAPEPPPTYNDAMTHPPY